MAKKPQSRNSSSKAGSKKNTNYKPVLIVAIVVAILAITAVLIWPMIRNDSVYSVNKDEVRADIASLLDKVNPPGELVYSDIVDLGCDSGGSVGLASVIHCDYMGYKYFVHQGDMGDILQTLDATLMTNGWHKNDDLIDKKTMILAGQEEGSVFYWRDSRTWAATDVEFYRDNEKINNTTIKDLIVDNKIALHDSSAVILGVRVSQAYWSCQSSNELFRLPCPASPGKAEPK